MPLPADDPARARFAELKARGATREEIYAAMETYEVTVVILLKALSPGHAKATASELANHMVDVHMDEGMAAVSSVSDAVEQPWIDRKIGDLDG